MGFYAIFRTRHRYDESQAIDRATVVPEVPVARYLLGRQAPDLRQLLAVLALW
jgi:hypothetical protein